jgi:hypothetical protein
VLGRGVIITAGLRAIQCGDMMTMPRKSAGKVLPQALSAGPVVPASTANSGAPWDTNRLGKVVMASTSEGVNWNIRTVKAYKPKINSLTMDSMSLFC